MLITDPLFYAIAIPVVLLSGISKTGIPGLFGGMAVPMLSLVIPPLQAAALMLPILCFIDLFGLRAFRGVYDRRNMPMLLAGLAIGIAAGMLVFTLVPRDFMRVVIGTIAVAFALNNIFGWARNRPRAAASWPRGVFWSSLSGLTSFVAHAGSPPIMAYLLPQRLDRRVYAIGVKLGVIIQGKLDEKVFYQISYWVLFALGVKLLYDGIGGILR